MTSGIDVVVVTADSPDVVRACVERLADAAIASVTVVDNGAAHQAVEALSHTRARVVKMERPAGLARAYNRGAAAGAAELVLFLNDDILAEPGSIHALARALDEAPAAAAAAGRLVDADDGTTQIEYQPRRFPSLATYVAAFGGLERFWRTNPWTGAHRRRPPSGGAVIAVDQPPGACLLVRRSTFDAVGGWDERFEFWYEDVDLARRLREHGAVLYVPGAPFRHVGGHSAQRLERAEVVSRSYRGALLYADKHFGPVQRRAAGALFAGVSGVRVLTSDGADAAAYRRILRAGLALAGSGHVPDE